MSDATLPPDFVYDEFGLFHENCQEVGLAYDGPPRVRREFVEVGRGSLADPNGPRRLSALVWGDAEPELIFLHGGAQNSHTWDTTLLALGRPAVCIDLPGHGRSDWHPDYDYSPQSMAAEVATAIRALAPNTGNLVGMSMGGLTSIALTARHPDLVRKLALVDVTPGVNAAKGKAITDFVNGPPTFPDFDALLARTIEHNPTRSVSSLRRGILHNAWKDADGVWRWRYDRREFHRPKHDHLSTLWDDVSRLSAPIMLLRGGLSAVVDDEDVAEVQRRQPSTRYEFLPDAGHSIQGDAPLELARLLDDFFFGT